MLVTTHDVPDHNVKLVAAMLLKRFRVSNTFLDRVASIVDTFGGRSRKYEKVLSACAELALMI